MNEYQIHKNVIHALETFGRELDWYWFHPFNKAKDAREGAIAKSMGVKAGVPDIIFLGRGRPWCLEIKTENGALSPAQLIAHRHLHGLGIDVEIGHGYLECMAILKRRGVLR